MKRFAVLALLLLPCACSEPTADKPVDAKSQIEGKWVCDFDKTWEMSKRQFLEQKRRHNTRLLGRIANTGQQGTRWEAEVREEVRSLASGLTIEFKKDGRFRFAAASQSLSGTYQVKSVTSSRIIVRMVPDVALRHQRTIGFEVTFESKNQLHFKELGYEESPPLYVMQRA